MFTDRQHDHGEQLLVGIVRGVVPDAHFWILPADARGGKAERLQSASHWLYEGAASQLSSGKKTTFLI